MFRRAWSIACAASLALLAGVTALSQEGDVSAPRAPRVLLYGSFSEALQAHDLYGALEQLPLPGETPEGAPAPVLESASEGCPELLAALLQQGHTLYDPALGTSVAHAAAAAGRLYTLEVAARAGADFGVTDKEGMLPLHTAARAGQPDAMEAMTYYGVPITALTDEAASRQAYVVAMQAKQFEVTARCRELGIVMTMFEAATSGDVQAIGDIFNVDPSSLEALDGIRNTPLLAAITVDQLESVKKLLALGAQWQASNVDGNGPIHIAILQNLPHMLPILMEYGVPLDSRRHTFLRESPVQVAVQYAGQDMLRQLLKLKPPLDMKDEEGFTPLQRAVHIKNVEKARLLMNAGADVHTQNKQGQGLLHTAAQEHTLDMAVLALEHGVRPDVWDIQRQTPIHYASRDGSAAVFDLLQSYGALTGGRDVDGISPLMTAAAHAKIDMLRRLATPEALALRDNAGKTALHHAVIAGDDECVRFLLEMGADPNALDKDGAPPLYYALYSTRENIARLLVEKGARVDQRLPDGRTMLFVPLHEDAPQITRWLLDEGLSPVEPDNHGWTPIHQAAKVGTEQTMQVLLDHGGTPALSDENSQTPMHVAAARGHILVIKVLHGAGADVMAADKQGWLPLHYAAQNGHWGPIQFFLLRGGNLEAELPDGRRPLHLAAQGGQVRTVALLVGRDADLLARDLEGRTALGLVQHERVIASNKTCRTPGDSDRELLAQMTANYLRLAYAEELARLIDRGDAATIALLLELHPEFTNLIFQERTPLQHAVETGNLAVAEALIKAGARPEERDEAGLGMTALHWAVAKGQREMAQMLAKKHPELMSVPDAGGLTPPEMKQAAGWDFNQ